MEKSNIPNSWWLIVNLTFGENGLLMVPNFCS